MGLIYWDWGVQDLAQLCMEANPLLTSACSINRLKAAYCGRATLLHEMTYLYIILCNRQRDPPIVPQRGRTAICLCKQDRLPF